MTRDEAGLRALFTAAAPLWTGEAEIIRAYFSSPLRTVDTDLLWLRRQCFKEFWGSGFSRYDRGGLFPGVLRNLVATTPDIDITVDRHEVLGVLDVLREEFSHYCAFADAHDAIRPAGTPRLNPHVLQGWPEEDELTALRHRHQDLHGPLGFRACRFTEGGYCRLLVEGMSLGGRGGRDEAIATACKAVYADEHGHLRSGIEGVAREDWTAADWTLLTMLVLEQLRQRIHMRHAQFSRPLPAARIAAILRGEAEPLEFELSWAE